MSRWTPTGASVDPEFPTTPPDLPPCWRLRARVRLGPRCRKPDTGCCWWPTSAKRARATCWGGGSGGNAIAQAARCKVDIRSENNARMDQLVDILASAVERARDLENQRQTGGRVTAKTREIGSRPAAVLPGDALILQYIRAVDA